MQQSSVQFRLNLKQAFILTAFIWIILCFAAGLPFIFSHATDSTIDSLFEAISALTGTGASIMYDLNNKSHGILLWRAILQWLGGIGIVVMAMVALPMLKVGGMQLFTSEFSDKSNDKILPQVTQITRAIFFIYLFFTLLCMGLLFMVGMGVFDAICHGFTIISTGGFSTKDGSIADFNNNHIKLVSIPFMIIGGATLLLFVRIQRGDWRVLVRDLQFRVYIMLMFGAIMILTLWQVIVSGFTGFYNSVVDIAFNVVSVMTTSGFAASDYTQYTPFAVTLLFILSIIGGCTGSTAGGIKVFRLKIMYTQTIVNLKKLRHTNNVVVPMHNKKVITQDIFESVYTYITLFILSVLISLLIISMMGVEFKTAIYAIFALVTNLGPAMDQTIGPFGSYAKFPDGVKIVFMMLMLLGRLEFIAIVVLFNLDFWRR